MSTIHNSSDEDLLESPKQSPRAQKKLESVCSNNSKEKSLKKNNTPINIKKAVKSSNNTSLGNLSTSSNPFQNTHRIPSLFETNIRSSSIFAQKSVVDSAYEQQQQPKDKIRAKFRQKQLSVEQNESRIETPQLSKDLESLKNLSFGTSAILVDDTSENLVDNRIRPARFNRLSHYSNGYSNSESNTSSNFESRSSQNVTGEKESQVELESLFFKKYCYSTLKKGECMVTGCSFSHQVYFIKVFSCFPGFFLIWHQN